jgi:hypothetical protein
LLSPPRVIRVLEELRLEREVPEWIFITAG